MRGRGWSDGCYVLALCVFLDIDGAFAPISYETIDRKTAEQGTKVTIICR